MLSVDSSSCGPCGCRGPVSCEFGFALLRPTDGAANFPLSRIPKGCTLPVRGVWATNRMALRDVDGHREGVFTPQRTRWLVLMNPTGAITRRLLVNGHGLQGLPQPRPKPTRDLRCQSNVHPRRSFPRHSSLANATVGTALRVGEAAHPGPSAPHTGLASSATGPSFLCFNTEGAVAAWTYMREHLCLDNRDVVCLPQTAMSSRETKGFIKAVSRYGYCRYAQPGSGDDGRAGGVITLVRKAVPQRPA